MGSSISMRVLARMPATAYSADPVSGIRPQAIDVRISEPTGEYGA